MNSPTVEQAISPGPPAESVKKLDQIVQVGLPTGYPARSARSGAEWADRRRISTPRPLSWSSTRA